MNGGGHATASAAPRRAHWRRLRRLLTLAFFVLVPVLLFLLVKNLDWQEVRHALGEYRPATLFLGLLLAAAGYRWFSSFDLLSRYIGHSLPKRRVHRGVRVQCVQPQPEFLGRRRGAALSPVQSARPTSPISPGSSPSAW